MIVPLFPACLAVARNEDELQRMVRLNMVTLSVMAGGLGVCLAVLIGFIVSWWVR